MKILLASLTFALSLSAFASFSEVECNGQAGQSSLFVAVEEGFPSGTIRRAMVRQNNATSTYHVMSRGAFANRVRYEGAGFQLEVDFWPDQRPQWAQTYRGTFSSNQLNIPFTMLWCRFPNIRP